MLDCKAAGSSSGEIDWLHLIAWMCVMLLLLLLLLLRCSSVTV